MTLSSSLLIWSNSIFNFCKFELNSFDLIFIGCISALSFSISFSLKFFSMFTALISSSNSFSLSLFSSISFSTWIEFKNIIAASYLLISSEISLYFDASSACLTKFLSWFSVCFIKSSAFFKLFSAAFNLSSASCLLACNPAIPAASSNIALRSVGFAVIKAPTRP